MMSCVAARICSAVRSRRWISAASTSANQGLPSPVISSYLKQTPVDVRKLSGQRPHRPRTLLRRQHQLNRKTPCRRKGKLLFSIPELETTDKNFSFLVYGSILY